jgi:hypothetical protein
MLTFCFYYSTLCTPQIIEAFYHIKSVIGIYKCLENTIRNAQTLNSTSGTIGHTGQVGANQPTEIVVSNNLGCLCTMINLLPPYLQHISLLA